MTDHYNSDGKPSIRASSQKVSTSDCNINETMTTGNSATWLAKPEIVVTLELQLVAPNYNGNLASQVFRSMESPNKVSPSDCDYVRQPEKALEPEIRISVEP